MSFKQMHLCNLIALSVFFRIYMVWFWVVAKGFSLSTLMLRGMNSTSSMAKRAL